MSIMKWSIFLLLCFTGVPGNLQVVRHDYHLITTPATWTDAQTYCRNNYVDLATVQTDDDWERLNAEAERKGLTTNGWVGMYLNVVLWYWSYKNVLIDFSVTNWAPGQPDNAGGDQSCCAVDSNGYWLDYACTEVKPTICYDANVGGFVAVPLPTLSWYGGQTYCRTYHTDLASADTLTDINQIQQLTAQQGTSWFGLFRDVWMWSDGTIPMGLKWGPGLPNNIDHDDNCGSVNNSLLMDRQCDNLFNFFCHTPYTVRYQVLKLQIKGDKSVFDPAVQSAILQQIVQKLKEHDIWIDITVTWRVRQDGSIFQKKLSGGL
ncbi:macrophage mannose receptor 1 [Ictalurus punctatus]|uniref:Macrophage mannose receptor 1 n=1 Tax=Ictalurus punctatus TaxID=7998 RepID=A0A2D0QFB7_ICTPU|nr:macrophage mannose receptor 1 [Ictalurus punctatus]